METIEFIHTKFLSFILILVNHHKTSVIVLMAWHETTPSDMKLYKVGQSQKKKVITEVITSTLHFKLLNSVCKLMAFLLF